MKNKRKSLEDRTTIKQYKELIAERQEEWNSRIANLDESNISIPLKKEIEKIDFYKTNSKSRKADYKRLYRELNYALQWDLDTPEGQRQLDLKEKKAFETFNEHQRASGHEEMSYDEWRDMVENFGSAGKSILEQFYPTRGYGSGDVVRVYREAKEKAKEKADGNDKPVNIQRAMRDVLKKSKGLGLTPQKILDMLRDELGLNS